jgi:transcription elongation factor Elf1
MTSIAFLKHSTDCPRCGEQAIAPEESQFVSAAEVHHFWCCWHCGHEFETLDRLSLGNVPPSEFIKKRLPSLLVA